MSDLLEGFIGRILPGTSLSEFNSADTMVLEPADNGDDLARALRLSNAHGRNVIVRSGSQFQHKPNAEHVAGNVVLNLTAQHPVAIDGDIIEAGAAESLGALAAKSALADLSLPLDDVNKSRSVISYVLSKAAAFPCSSSRPDHLIDHVDSAHVVYIEHPQHQGDLTGDQFRLAVDAGPVPFVVTRLRLKSDGPAKDRWFHCWAVVFDPSTITDLITAMEDAEALNGVDLSLRAQSGPFGVSMIVIRATGLGDDQPLVDFMNTALQGKNVMKQFSARGALAIARWMLLSPVEQMPARLINTISIKSDTPRELSALKDPFTQATRFLVGLNPDGSDPTPGIMAWLVLRRSARAKNLFNFDAQMLVNEITASPNQVAEGRRLLERLSHASSPLPFPLSLLEPIYRAISHALHFGGGSKPNLETRRAGLGVIPNFMGDLFQTGTASYFTKSEQYAKSSYSDKVVAKRMTPLMIVVPKTADDVVAVLEYAAAHSFHVAPRSGGHQYCGLSSGGSDTIQILLDEFDSLSIAADRTVTVGAGTPLFKLSSALLNANLAMPFGECPLVAVGGHLQTGGVGHLLRTLGLALDYVKAFTMVTIGADKKAIVKRYERPKPGVKDDLFSAVLGGGPGSWGVILSWEIEVIENVPDTVGYTYYYLYNKDLHDSKRAFAVAMSKCEEWNRRQVEGRLPDDQDLFVSFVSGQHIRPTVILVETAATTQEGARDIRQVVDDVSAVQPPIPVFGKRIDGDSTLSKISNLGVRDLLVGMPAGREFFWPFKKSMHCTTKAWEPGFVEKFVDLVDRVHDDPDTACVVQAVVGGGKLLKPRQTCNRMQRRNATFQLVFDVFYTPDNPNGEKKAIAFQNEMNKLLPLYSDGDERMFWATWQRPERGEKDTDMKDARTQNYYYDSPEEYRSLQKIKKQVDPLDIFHTDFTVQL